ncbi:MAG: hypothetical protein GYA55_07605, partial [SAR324 cluster bacterium]|nr:hypothetical protein [SAR324 cluster bacterium]
PLNVQLSILVGNKSRSQDYRSELLYFSAQDESTFEGKVLSVNYYTSRFGPYYIAPFSRLNLNIPGDTYYAVMPANRYFQTNTQEVMTAAISDTLDGSINDFRVVETNINQSSNITLQGQAMDEMNRTLMSLPLSLYWLNATNNSWVQARLVNGATNFTTSTDGTFNIQVPLSQTPLSSISTLQVRFAGNATVKPFSQSINITKNQYEAKIRVSVYLNNVSSILGKLVVGDQNLATVTIVNTGNASIMNLGYSVSSTSGFTSTNLVGVVSADTVLSPGESMTFQTIFSAAVSSFDHANISYTFSGNIVETGQIYSSEFKLRVGVFRVPENSLGTTTFIILFFLGVGGLWIGAYLYIRKSTKQMNEAVLGKGKSSAVSTPSGSSKYVKVSELAMTPKDKAAEKPKEGTDLDALLKEEGVKDTEKPDSKKEAK